MHFVHYREVVLLISKNVLPLNTLESPLYRGVLYSECPLSEVPLYTHTIYFLKSWAGMGSKVTPRGTFRSSASVLSSSNEMRDEENDEGVSLLADPDTVALGGKQE